MNDYKLAKLNNVAITNIKTGNYIFGYAEHYENTQTGKMKYSGRSIKGSEVSWNEEHCKVEKFDNFTLDIRIK